MSLSGTIRSSSWLQRIVYAAVGLQLVHAGSILFLKHPLAVSNVVQVILPVLVVAGCQYKHFTSRSAPDQRAWMLLAIAFGLWTAAEVCYLVESYCLSPESAFSSVDDVLWLLFAVPLLLVLSGSLEGKLNWVSWMDQIQAFVFFVVVAVLVYSHPSIISFDTAYSVQNVALLLSCSLRYSAAETDHEENFFGRLGIYLAIYLLSAGLGNAFAHRGWNPGSAVDLLWTLPLTLLCVLMLGNPTNDRLHTKKRPGGDLTRYLHDLSALGLAALSMGGSVYLLLHCMLAGSVCLAFSFVLFAVRTCGRVRELYQSNERLNASVLEDALTGLGNRAFLRQHLDRLLTTSTAVRGNAEIVAVLFIDLDRFKAINDSLGHDVGDKVLVEVAERITTSCQAGAVACRLGGDEFVVVLNAEAAEQAEHVAATILAGIRAPFWIGSKVLQLSGSIGVAIARGEDKPNDVLRKADQAMYRAKRLGKSRIELGDDSLATSSHMGYLLEAELRDCLEHQQIRVYLQPIYSLQDNDVCGFEALARWHHPRLGTIPPSQFIPLAEETGMILELGRQVLTCACREIVRWNTIWNTRLSISVNVSARQFSDPNLLPSILGTLARLEMDPRLLHLEITESVLLIGEDTVAKVLMAAQRQGMQISLDDFGTGYSSLSYLLNFPSDEIKIDQSFVRGLNQDPKRAELVRTVLQLGRSLNKRVVAEGVETHEELHALQKMGCKYVQGNLFENPFPAEDLSHQPLFTKSPFGVTQNYGHRVV